MAGLNCSVVARSLCLWFFVKEPSECKSGPHIAVDASRKALRMPESRNPQPFMVFRILSSPAAVFATAKRLLPVAKAGLFQACLARL
jgi:hypothetical protein